MKRNSRSVSCMSPPVKSADIEIHENIRYKTGVSELDRVFGGGIVKGTLILLGGAPGIGKSTLLLQISDSIGSNPEYPGGTLYVSGEESKQQVKIRSDRLGLSGQGVFIMCETDIEVISEQIKYFKPALVIIDSIQTMIKSDIASSAGSVTQVKLCASQLLELAKNTDIPIFIVSHVNKDGAIAGPKVLEHIVDVVLYFEAS
ncbi:MAG: AAA family ATPase [Oscillospiraceae bacterium]|nr:AAA family ATPase [Oscillospiraceae bacterium]